MIKINNRYLSTEEIRNDITTRVEVLASHFVNDFILPNDIWNVGAETNLNLPDIYNDTKTIGFEVVRCEANVDFIHDDITKELIKINYSYYDYLHIKNQDPNHVFNKLDLDITLNQGKITSTSIAFSGHTLDWMKDDYKTTLTKKLNKLNKGNYSECEHVSLIILNLSRLNGLINAQQVQNSYLQIKNDYTKKFDYIYYVTTNGIYVINKEDIQILQNFNDDGFSKCVKEMKMTLKIDEYHE